MITENSLNTFFACAIYIQPFKKWLYAESRGAGLQWPANLKTEVGGLQFQGQPGQFSETHFQKEKEEKKRTDLAHWSIVQ